MVPRLTDPERLAVLSDLSIMDTPPEQKYDDLARLAAMACGSSIGAVNFVDGTRHWTKAIVGVDGAQGSEVSADVSFCAATVGTDAGDLAIPDTHASEEWREHPLVRAAPFVRNYAGASIVVEGQPVGVVCVFGTAPREFGEREHQALDALASNAAAHLELRSRNAKLRHLAVRDALTGLPNRILLVDHLAMALTQRRRRSCEVGVLFCDLDHFKEINDRWGHEAGDRILCAVAGALRTATRATDTVARFAGDEFVIVCPELDSEDELAMMAERVRSAVGRIGVDVTGAEVGVSVGAALASDGDTPADVLRRADEAMYRVKAPG